MMHADVEDGHTCALRGSGMEGYIFAPPGGPQLNRLLPLFLYCAGWVALFRNAPANE